MEAVVEAATPSTHEAPPAVLVHLPGGLRVEMRHRGQALVVELWHSLEGRQPRTPC